MNPTRLQRFWKRLVIFMVMTLAVFTMLKPIPAHAGDFTTAAPLPTNGEWSEKYKLADATTDYYQFTISTAGKVNKYYI